MGGGEGLTQNANEASTSVKAVVRHTPHTHSPPPPPHRPSRTLHACRGPFDRKTVNVLANAGAHPRSKTGRVRRTGVNSNGGHPSVPPSHVYCVPVPLCPRSIVSQSHYVPSQLCPSVTASQSVSQFHCVPVSCPSLIVSQSHCVPVPLCPGSIVSHPTVS